MAFQLKSNRKETENKTIQNKDVTFSSFVIQACEYALKDMENGR